MEKSTGGGPYRIDVHHHIVPPTWLAHELKRTPTRTAMEGTNLSAWTPARALEALDRAEIRTAITSITAPGVWFGDIAASRKLARECNEYAADMAREFKGRFGFFAALPLPDIQGSLNEISYAFDILEADGIGLVTNYDDTWPGDARFAPIFDELDRRNAVVYFHPTEPACCANIMPEVAPALIEFPFDTTRAIVSLLLSGTISRFPRIRWIFSHGGGTLPMLAGRIAGIVDRLPHLRERVGPDVMRVCQTLYYDTTSLFHPTAFRATQELAGTTQLLFGTDYPYWQPEANITALGKQRLTRSELRAVEKDNATRLFGKFA
jgi:6-methylsalicylate decarboxylase